MTSIKIVLSCLEMILSCTQNGVPRILLNVALELKNHNNDILTILLGGSFIILSYLSLTLRYWDSIHCRWVTTFKMLITLTIQFLKISYRILKGRKIHDVNWDVRN